MLPGMVCSCTSWVSCVFTPPGKYAAFAYCAYTSPVPTVSDVPDSMGPPVTVTEAPPMVISSSE